MIVARSTPNDTNRDLSVLHAAVVRPHGCHTGHGSLQTPGDGQRLGYEDRKIMIRFGPQFHWEMCRHINTSRHYFVSEDRLMSILDVPRSFVASHGCSGKSQLSPQQNQVKQAGELADRSLHGYSSRSCMKLYVWLMGIAGWELGRGNGRQLKSENCRRPSYAVLLSCDQLAKPQTMQSSLLSRLSTLCV